MATTTEISQRNKKHVTLPPVDRKKAADLETPLTALEQAGQALITEGIKATAPFVTEAKRHSPEDFTKVDPSKLSTNDLLLLQKAGHTALNNLKALSGNRDLRKDIGAKTNAVDNAYHAKSEHSPEEEKRVAQAKSRPAKAYQVFESEVDGSGLVSILTSAADKEAARRGVAHTPSPVEQAPVEQARGNRGPAVASNFDRSIAEIGQASQELAAKASKATKPFIDELARTNHNLSNVDVKKMSDDDVVRLRDSGISALDGLRAVGRDEAVRNKLEGKIKAASQASNHTPAAEKRLTDAIASPQSQYQQIHEEVETGNAPIAMVTLAAAKEARARGLPDATDPQSRQERPQAAPSTRPARQETAPAAPSVWETGGGGWNDR